ncbi:helicase-related protein [Tenacibaculum caenipelagi]|uniref:Helicase-like protein n=1 Tax=Tenacibaculum caenipelagi TaxID=1325435 RepID=A0A4R6TF94_9FLAO|nr:helicase-related protein [Tenacibaculum caenipelagi]TDQ24013.1 helicase-like protein [Tenacibaculum caenipelagi]
MDRIEETSNVLRQINNYKNGRIEDFILIKHVCNYFDKIKDQDLKQTDYKFLIYLANISGVPHFFDILNSRFNHDSNIEDFDLNTFSSLLYESTLHTDSENKLHKYQSKILGNFERNRLNRYFLSASTSFGKTHIVYEILKKMEYKNVVLIFPTIALLSENLERIIANPNYSYFKENYKIHTLSEVDEFGEQNLFIYTPERFLSYYEKHEYDLEFDFSFVDEIYKIDNDYIIDEETKENERDVAYRLAVFYSLSNNSDSLLAGPYLEFHVKDSNSYNSSFDFFLEKNNIELIDYNNYEIVNKSYSNIKSSRSYKIDVNLNLQFTSNNKTQRLIQTLNQINTINQNAIVYCANRGKNGGVEGYALSIIESKIYSNHNHSNYQDLIDHISSNFSQDWVLVKGLKNGIGIHHGLIPKYLQKEIISLFNEGLLNVLISTTTITEGVNTSAKNLIVMHNKKGNKDLKKFDAKNIAGRAGRFGYHYSGRVIVLKNDFMETIDSQADGIKHKNYDPESPKDEIDLFYSEDVFLNQNDRLKKQTIITEQRLRNLPESLFSMYKVVSRMDKIKLYDSISEYSETEFELIKRLIRIINFRMDIDYDGFQVLLKTIKPIVKNKNLKFLIEYTGETSEYSMLTNLIHFYLNGGFKGSISYNLSRGNHIDKAITETSKFVYNTLKYQVVKYLGVFNLMYKYVISTRTNIKMEDVKGIDKLLLKFEYNAVTDEGRIASDYGVPATILKYYESPENRNTIKNSFDNFENNIFNKIESVINR